MARAITSSATLASSMLPTAACHLRSSCPRQRTPGKTSLQWQTLISHSFPYALSTLKMTKQHLGHVIHVLQQLLHVQVNGRSELHLSCPIGCPNSEMSSDISEVVAVLGGSLALRVIFERDARAACAATAAGGPVEDEQVRKIIILPSRAGQDLYKLRGRRA